MMAWSEPYAVVVAVVVTSVLSGDYLSDAYGTVTLGVFTIGMLLEIVVLKGSGILTLRLIAVNLIIERLNISCTELCWNCSSSQFSRLWSRG